MWWLFPGWCPVGLSVAGLCCPSEVDVCLVCGGGGVAFVVGVVSGGCGGLAPCVWCACLGGCCWPGLVWGSCVCRMLGCGAVWDGVSCLLELPVVMCPLQCAVGAAGAFAGDDTSFLPAGGPVAV